MRGSGQPHSPPSSTVIPPMTIVMTGKTIALVGLDSHTSDQCECSPFAQITLWSPFMKLRVASEGLECELSCENITAAMAEEHITTGTAHNLVTEMYTYIYIYTA